MAITRPFEIRKQKSLIWTCNITVLDVNTFYSVLYELSAEFLEADIHLLIYNVTETVTDISVRKEHETNTRYNTRRELH